MTMTIDLIFENWLGIMGAFPYVFAGLILVLTIFDTFFERFI